MGSGTSVCVDLLEQMGWKDPPLANDFHHPGLVNYLSHTLLEVVLPVHAPQNDISSESKPRQYPRPTFCWEAYKMHLAMIGPSSTCKKQFLEFMPRIAHIFKGTSTKLAPGREAVPYHFFDSDLHRVVLWDLPEIQFKQKAEDYIRELGLLYIDCVFMLFSEKYVLTDIYCKLCVAMALHGIPFFVLCTQSEDGMDEKAVRRLQSSFQAQSVQVRMFNPAKPHETLEPLINDFFKEVSWNRSKGANTDRIKNASDAVLGQTVRIKNLEKKAELNGRCGVCIGFEKDQDRYIVRLITGGVESDIALRDQNFSILKPKLRGALVQVQGLQSKPELNGRYGFVDEFLRENERYRVFLPDKPGSALTIALKSENLEKVSATNAKPIAVSAAANGTKPEASKSFAPAPRASAKAATNGASRTAVPKAEPKEAPKPTAQPSKQEEKEEDFSAFLPKVGAADDEGSDDLMSRIFAAEKNEAEVQSSTQKAPPAVPEKPAEKTPVRRLQLSLHGLLGLRVWAVIGESPEAEDLSDHLMECGKTVFDVSSNGTFASTAELGKDPNLPKTEVLAFVDRDPNQVLKALDDAIRLGVRGIVVHGEDSCDAEALAECRGAGLVSFSVDLLNAVQPGTGFPVAPLD